MAIFNLDRDQPGFRPNSKYGKEWYGVLLETLSVDIAKKKINFG